MIDVMLILLVFFMVTSTYLNLDMIPAADRSEDTAEATSADTGAGTLLIRLGAGWPACGPWPGAQPGHVGRAAAI